MNILLLGKKRRVGGEQRLQSGPRLGPAQCLEGGQGVDLENGRLNAIAGATSHQLPGLLVRDDPHVRESPDVGLEAGPVIPMMEFTIERTGLSGDALIGQASGCAPGVPCDRDTSAPSFEIAAIEGHGRRRRPAGDDYVGRDVGLSREPLRSIGGPRSVAAGTRRAPPSRSVVLSRSLRRNDTRDRLSESGLTAVRFRKTAVVRVSEHTEKPDLVFLDRSALFHVEFVEVRNFVGRAETECLQAVGEVIALPVRR